MTKDIMLRISGVQFPDGEENSEEMEVITSGSYFEKDGRHYIKYDEVQEELVSVKEEITEGTNGKTVFAKEEPVAYAFDGKTPVFF